MQLEEGAGLVGISPIKIQFCPRRTDLDGKTPIIRLNNGLDLSIWSFSGTYSNYFFIFLSIF
ncbi:hypothetical protein [Ammoniphilus sp. 3BR4]|uniref:hypothetical protein n=1 Tax=Ammoniphilus sp. 3BR4 TaxID=3158265 RepID=UPI0034661A78